MLLLSTNDEGLHRRPRWLSASQRFAASGSKLYSVPLRCESHEEGLSWVARRGCSLYCVVASRREQLRFALQSDGGDEIWSLMRLEVSQDDLRNDSRCHGITIRWEQLRFALQSDGGDVE